MICNKFISGWYVKCLWIACSLMVFKHSFQWYPHYLFAKQILSLEECGHKLHSLNVLTEPCLISVTKHWELHTWSSLSDTWGKQAIANKWFLSCFSFTEECYWGWMTEPEKVRSMWVKSLQSLTSSKLSFIIYSARSWKDKCVFLETHTLSSSTLVHHCKLSFTVKKIFS